jgi:uncharacterized protein YifN (PemK superfamily)
MLFLNNKKNRHFSRKIFKSIESKLYGIDEEIANEYLCWLDKKTNYLKKTLDKEGYGLQPDNLTQGDIVWVEFGINVGTELSDYKTKGHYGVVWKVDLGNVIVIPLSSNKTNGSTLTYDIGIIEGLNESENTISYLKLDAIRSISKRRIGRMNNKDNGKLELSKEKIELIRRAIFDSFVVELDL